MTTTTDTYTNGSQFEADAIANAINTAYAAGAHVTINGREVYSHWTRNRNADSNWQNGSVSVNVRGRRAGSQGTVWIKKGESAHIEISQPASA